jgi:tungstate transport system substrate-binding protein
MRGVLAVGLVALVVACGQPPPGSPANQDVFIGSTTTTQDTGLLDELIPDFQRRTGYRAKTVIGGTGQVLTTAGRGDLDVVLVHSPPDEVAFISAGNGVERQLVMHNDFVLVGPASDPAHVRGRTVLDAFRSIGDARAGFISRGDRSGTHVRELSLWSAAGIDPSGKPWYVGAAAGQLQTLHLAAQKNAYALADRGTWLANQGALIGLEVLVQGGRELLNVYHVILVNPDRFPKVNTSGGRAFAAYLVGADGQRLIASFGIARFGRPLFVPDAGKNEETLE